jgi:tRNA(His) guanylyltransferase
MRATEQQTQRQYHGDLTVASDGVQKRCGDAGVRLLQAKAATLLLTVGPEKAVKLACTETEASCARVPKTRDHAPVARRLCSSAPAAIVVGVSHADRDPLGARMKGYEQEWRSFFPERSWTVLRLDGKSFHTWTVGLERPYSLAMVEAMAATTQALCERVPGAVLGYTQSDEITIVCQSFSGERTQQWYNGAVQKQVSVAASLATAVFGRRFPEREIALFDARAFVLPNRVEVMNCLYWRGQDAKRNAISMLGQARFTPEALHGVSSEGVKTMLAEAGHPAEDADPRFLVGQFCFQRSIERNGAVRRVWELAPATNLRAAPESALDGLLPADPT